MKKFENPSMTVIFLSGEDVVCSSCNTQMCYEYDCYECPKQCNGVYHCDVFKCTTYEG